MTKSSLINLKLCLFRTIIFIATINNKWPPPTTMLNKARKEFSFLTKFKGFHVDCSLIFYSSSYRNPVGPYFVELYLHLFSHVILAIKLFFKGGGGRIKKTFFYLFLGPPWAPRPPPLNLHYTGPDGYKLTF